MTRPLPVFGALRPSENPSAPQDVRVFEGGRFLYASFDFGREQMLDIRAHDRLDLLQYWHEWMKPAPAPAPVAPTPAERHERTPERPGQPQDEVPGEFVTSLSPRPRAQMTLAEYLTA